MKRDGVVRSRRSVPFSILGAGVLLLTGLTVGAISAPAGAVAPPALTITPGPYHNEQLINLSVGPNHYFTPYSRINIIECADPSGKPANLPISVTGCDGNTIQGVTILVQRDGSWYEHGYQLYALPNTSQLGESADSQPVCNQKMSCVLYIGQNQEKFTAPKVFSHPFVIRKSSKHS
jgi:hypothetical protein